MTIYFLNFAFRLRNNAIRVKTTNEQVIREDIAYKIASAIEPPLKFKATVICLSIASNILNIGYTYPGIIQKIRIIADIIDINIVFFICFFCKNKRKICRYFVDFRTVVLNIILFYKNNCTETY